MLCFYEKRLWNLEDVSEEVDVCTGRSGHDGHGERGIDILQVAPHWRLTDYKHYMYVTVIVIDFSNANCITKGKSIFC